MEETYEAMKMALEAAKNALAGCATAKNALSAVSEDEEIEFQYLSEADAASKSLENLIAALEIDMEAFAGEPQTAEA